MQARFQAGFCINIITTLKFYHKKFFYIHRLIIFAL